MAAKKPSGYFAFEKKDKAADKKAGIKENGKRDMKMDAMKMRGLPTKKGRK